MLLIIEPHVWASFFFIHKHVVERGDEAVVATLKHIDWLKKSEWSWTEGDYSWLRFAVDFALDVSWIQSGKLGTIEQ